MPYTPWKLIYNKFDPEQEQLIEALCTLGNGYFGTRGATPGTSQSKVHYPGTYIAGVFNTLPTEIANRTIYNEDFVNCPNWLMFNYRIDNGPWYDRLKVKILNWKAELNIKKGILSRRVRWQDQEGRITLMENHRLVSMSNPHCGALRVSITPENYDGKITIRSGIDGLIINAGVDRYKQLSNNHLEPVDLGTIDDNGLFLRMKTNQSNIFITEAIKTRIFKDSEEQFPTMHTITHGRQRIMTEFTLDVEQGMRQTIDKLVSIYTSRDQGVEQDRERAIATVKELDDFESLFHPHKAKWESFWKRYDIEVKGDPFVQFTLRLHAFHLLQSASTYNEDIDAGMPVRGLHGEAYRGHIFWDELYVYPFYNLRSPEITRALLMYRFRRLEAAKENAREHGYRGAMFPWQSASRGDETSQEIHLNPMSGTWGPDYSSLQRHVSIAIAYNAWTYFFSTGDRDFLDRYGAELILEIAHFWSSITHFNKESGRYEIHGVMGPDEFHEKYPGANKGGINNNAYTNILAVWVIDKALTILNEMMIEEDRNALLLKIGVDDKELKRWKEIIHKMKIPIRNDGLIEQFDGYFDLEELDWELYRSKYDNIHRVDRILKAEGKSPDSYKVAKQADVLMTFFVLNPQECQRIFTQLGYSFSTKLIETNFDYYFPRCSHGSTLSMVVHAYVANLIGRKDKLFEYLTVALKSDIYDTQGGTTQEGIHSGVMGSSIDLFLKCYGGLSISGDRIVLDPFLNSGWEQVKFTIRFQNIWFNIKINNDEVQITPKLHHPQPALKNIEIPIRIQGNDYVLKPKKIFKVPFKR